MKHRRRSRVEVDRLKAAIYDIVEEFQPMTVRQVFYQCVSRGLIDKTEAEYKNTVVRLLTDMRLERELPFAWIADETRWVRRPQTHNSLESALERTRRFYRRDLWENQQDHVEIWLEKEALAGVLFAVTAEWDTRLLVTRGYPSLTYLHTAAEAIQEMGKPTYLYYFGDHDPSGRDIQRNARDRLSELGADFTIERVAVTEQQIADFDLPTRPTKASDTRSKTFEGGSVEVDAIPPPVLRSLVEECIRRHIDERALEAVRVAEESEREILDQVMQMVQEGEF